MVATVALAPIHAQMELEDEMIVRADLDATQADTIRAEAARQGCTANELARRVLSQWLYELVARHMDPSRQPKQYVSEDWP